MALRPWASGLLWRVGRLGDDIGNAERAGYGRAETIGRLVIEVIGEPEIGCGLRRTIEPAQQPVGQIPAEFGQPDLP